MFFIYKLNNIIRIIFQQIKYLNSVKISLNLKKMNSQEEMARMFNPCGIDFSSLRTTQQTQRTITNKNNMDSKPFELIQQNYFNTNSSIMFLNQE